MRTLFFGTSTRKLLGVYHPAATGPGSARVPETGIVLCYPGVQEYNVSHGAFRKLATLLGRAGFPVLRFDYYGTGDSEGEIGEGTLEAGVRDIRDATAELKELSGVRDVALVGFRLGALLAARCVAEGLPVSSLVLWDPVVVGRNYIDELETRDRQQNLLLLHPTPHRPRHRAELLGYPFPDSHRAELERVDLRSLKFPSADRIILLVTEENRTNREFRAKLESERQFKFQFVPEDTGATNWGSRESILLASKVPAAIKDAMLDSRS